MVQDSPRTCFPLLVVLRCHPSDAYVRQHINHDWSNLYSLELENLDARLENIRNVVQSLPQANFDLLRRVSEHLDK